MTNSVQVFTTGVLVFSAFSANSFAQRDEKPNVLWITIEDTSPQFIGCYGNKAVKTPVIDQLASQGVRFTNAFATAPVCSSSRSTIITGVATEALGTGNHRSNYPIPDFIKGFPHYLRKAGYYTTNNVKTDYNIAGVKEFIDEAWDECSAKATWKNRADGQPFFAVFNFMSSHQSRTMTNSWNWYEKNVLDELPRHFITDTADFDNPPFYRNSPEMKKHFSRVYNSINLTDMEIGKLIQQLKDDGLYDNTIIIFYADHGEGIPRGKCNPIALGYKVPFIIRFPEKYHHLNPWGHNTVSDELVSLEDLAPSMLSLAGIELQDYFTGRAFLGNNRQKTRPYVYASRNRIDESPDLARSITDGRYIYTRVFMPHYPVMKFQKYSDVSDLVKIIRDDYSSHLLNSYQSELIEAPRPMEYLFDLQNGEWELNNLASDKNYSKIKRKFQNALFSHLVHVKDVHFLSEHEILARSAMETAYEIRNNRSDFNIKPILKIASKTGMGEKSIVKQLKALEHKDPGVRFWALVGLLNQQPQAVIPYKNRIMAMLNDKNPSCKIEAAGLLFKFFADSESKRVLFEQALSDDKLLALQALQKIQYSGRTEQFVALFEKVIEKWAGQKNNMLVYEIVCCAEVSLYFLGKESLSY
jgi:arylsulfatase A-like enzyme